MRAASLAGALAIALAANAGGAGSAPPPGQPLVITADIDGIVHPITAEFMTGVLDRADAANAALVVFTLRTPGGLVDSTRVIVSRMIAARTPVVMFVGPGGARAASAGFILVIAADVAVMAPGTHIGAAHPVQADGQDAGKGNEQLEKKAASDVAAYVRSLAESRRRNTSLAAAAVIESRAFTDREALAASPPLIDFVASDVEALVRQLDGRAVRRFDGREVVLRTAGARLERVEMTRRQRALGAIAHPQVAYLLFSLGVLGLTVELWNPGLIAPGVVGGICLLLAFFAFQILPVSTAGLLLMVLGVILLLLEVKVPSFGILGIGGLASLFVGSLMLDRSLPDVRLGLELVLPVVLALAGILLFLGRLAVAAQRRRATTGVEGLTGAPGQALTPLEPGQTGQIFVQGEIWNATAGTRIPAGAAVRVVAVEGLMLRVGPAGSSGEETSP